MQKKSQQSKSLHQCLHSMSLECNCLCYQMKDFKELHHMVASSFQGNNNNNNDDNNNNYNYLSPNMKQVFHWAFSMR